MSKRNFTGHCPHCAKHIGDDMLRTQFESQDYSTSFTLLCPQCGEAVECNVLFVAEFELSKAETPEEYQAKRAAMLAMGNGKQ